MATSLQAPARSDKPVTAIVVAAGHGERARGDDSSLPKQYRPVAGVPLLKRTIDALLGVTEVGEVQPVIHPEHKDFFAGLALRDDRVLPPTYGGATRQASVLSGLKAVAARNPQRVLIHDAARPFVDRRLVEAVLVGLAE